MKALLISMSFLAFANQPFHQRGAKLEKRKKKSGKIELCLQPETYAHNRTQTLVPMFEPLCKRSLSWGKIIDETHCSKWVCVFFFCFFLVGDQFTCNFPNSSSYLQSDVMLVSFFILKAKAACCLGPLCAANMARRNERLQKSSSTRSWCGVVADIQISLDCSEAKQ